MMIQHPSRTDRTRFFQAFATLIGAVVIAGLFQTATAAPLCVNPGGTSGCYSTIGAAVAAAAPYSTILVAPGAYTEDVIIERPLTLIGTNSATTIIDASGKANGIYINGQSSPGLSNVVVAGFTVENANFEGILVADAALVVVQGNLVTGNNKNLDATPACPGIPSFETAEGFDCGEGIHLTGVDHSSVTGNTVASNAGGILLADETGPTHDTLSAGNTIKDNPFDCGITLASHPPAVAGATSPFGVYDNTISNNVSMHNGYQVPGAGAGVGIFTFLPGGRVSGNVVTNNQLMNNGLPGVAFHAHGPGENLNDNVITANQISGNGADTQDAATPGPTGIKVYGVSDITGTVISHNVIKNETADIVVNTGGLVKANLNDLLGGDSGASGVSNGGTGKVDATLNYWGCAGGPTASGCSTVSGSGVSFVPWLRHAIP